MGESTKAVTALILIISSLVAAVAWGMDRPDNTIWSMRVGGTTMAALALALLLRLHFRADAARDYLRKITRNYFNRDGFCFAFDFKAINGVAYLETHFQNQYDQPLLGRIALRPARGFFLNRPNIDTITIEISCPPAGFGISRVAIPITPALQGKKQSFEVGAFVHYPQGKGNRLRFFDGMFLRTNANFSDPIGTTLSVLSATTGSIYLSSPAKIRLSIPTGLSPETPQDTSPETAILWQLGDPCLDSATSQIVV